MAVDRLAGAALQFSSLAARDGQQQSLFQARHESPRLVTEAGTPKGRGGSAEALSLELYQSLVDSMEDAVDLKDQLGRYLLVNSEKARRLGRGREEIIGRTPWDLEDPETARGIMDAHLEVLRTGTAVEVEERSPDRQSPEIFHVKYTPVRDGLGEIVAVATVSREVTQVVRERETLLYQAMVDDLTGLYNRRAFTAMAEHQLKLADRMEMPISLLFIDMDDLKAINDDHGHRRGDEAIATVARLLKENCRSSDLVARFGGDEFVVLVIDSPPDRVAALIRRLRHACLAATIDARPLLPLSISIGSVHRPARSPMTLGEMLIRADRSMYEEKLGNRAAPGRQN